MKFEIPLHFIAYSILHISEDVKCLSNCVIKYDMQVKMWQTERRNKHAVQRPSVLAVRHLMRPINDGFMKMTWKYKS